MFSQEIKMDNERIEQWVERQSTATAEWNAEETNEAGEVSEVKPLGIEAFEPGVGLPR